MVIIRVLCCFVVVQYLFENSTSNVIKPYIKNKILSSIGRLCPNVRICQEDFVLPHDVLDGRPHDSVPCCGVCSCADNCDEKGNCCFQSKAIENSTSEAPVPAEPKSYHSTCLFPGTSKNTWGLNYEMIDTCPYTNSESDRHLNTSNVEIIPERCGDVRVAWNEMLPVYSPTTKKLYKNTACSSCHGIKDGIVWDIILICNENMRNMRIDMSEFLNINPGQSEASICKLKFSFPGNWIELEHARCLLQQAVNTCAQIHFEIPADINMTTAEVVEACETGFYSPVIPQYSTNIFANMYCSVCNSEFQGGKFLCGNRNNMIHRFQSQFSYLLKGFDFERKYLRKQNTEAVIPKACFDESIETLVGSPQERNCRPVHCRNGQIRNRAGECHYIITYWSTIYDLIVDLIPDRNIPIEYLEDVKNDLALTWLKTPFRNHWKNIMLLYQSNIVNRNATLEKLIAFLRFRTSVPVGNVLMSVKSLLKKQWYIHLNGTTFNLRQELSPFYDFYPSKKHPNCVITSYWTQNGTMCRFN